MSFTDKDILMHRGLMKLLDEAQFSLKAREVNAFAQVYNWAKALPESQRSKPKKVKGQQ